MNDEKIKATVSQHIDISIEITIEGARTYRLSMPYGASFAEAHTVTLEMGKAIVEMAETAKKQQEEKEEGSKDEDVKE